MRQAQTSCFGLISGWFCSSFPPVPHRPHSQGHRFWLSDNFQTCPQTTTGGLREGKPSHPEGCLRRGLAILHIQSLAQLREELSRVWSSIFYCSHPTASSVHTCCLCMGIRILSICQNPLLKHSHREMEVTPLTPDEMTKTLIGLQGANLGEMGLGKISC